uniref:Uncharacterized protein n=1 Tax=Globisporangium ultimum (strain ATCC 200006 / CBS 805.95 / DAOM BR144) TaxID=431595 RepID=K3WBK8_GLOUD
MECIPQNKDCGVEVVTKISAVANAALSTASVGVFGHITKTVKGLDVAVRCGKQLYDIVQKILEHIADIEEKQPKTTKEQLVTLLMKSDFAVIDLPLAVTTCIGSSIANAFSTASEIVTPVKNIINAVIEKRAAALEPKTFVELSTTAGVKQVGKMPATEVSKLDKVITCGGELKSIVDKVIAKVNEIKEKAPASPVDAIRLSLTTSELFLVDIPQATNDCIPKSTKDFYAVRDQVRKSFQTIIDKVIDSSSDTATKTEKPLKKRDYALKVASFGLDAIAFFDPTGIAAMAREFIQKICGPTQFIGEVDDGPLEKALGLHTIGKAFETSNGAYKKKGDGKVKLTFISNDNENVEVNIFSAGQLIDTVKLENGVVKKWEKSMKEMQDKTLYLDRWRPGFLRIPGTGGGSLVMWIPHSSQGGHVDLTVSVNVS